MIILNRIYNEDCLITMSKMEDCFIDLVVTSPPYGNLRTYNGYFDFGYFDFKNIAKELYRVTKQGGVVVWIEGDTTKDGSESTASFRHALYFRKVGFNLHDTMIYAPYGTGAKGSKYSYWQAFEYMFVLSKGRPKVTNLIADVKNKTIGLLRGGRYREHGSNEKPHLTKAVGRRTNIWQYYVGFMDHSDKTGHPAPFPEGLANDHIISWSNEGDICYDPFIGSGTTAKMALLNSRKFIGSEISRDYCKMAMRRIQGLVK